MMAGSWAYIRFIERPSFDWQGRPLDPNYGIDEGAYPDQDLPGFPGRPPHVGNRPPGSGRPPHVGGGPARPGRPIDPNWGIEEGLPPEIWPLPPGGGGLPPIAGHPLPPTDPPPGTIWPPLPPSIPEGKVLAVVWISGIGARYAVLTVSPPLIDNTLPGQPGVPDQGLPPEAQPKVRR